MVASLDPTEATDAAARCVAQVPKPRILIQFLGLVDLASEDPLFEGVTSQDDVEVSLVDATDPDEVEVKDNWRLANHAPVLYFPSVLNATLGMTTGTAGRRMLDLKSTTVTADAPKGRTVTMHQEELLGIRPTYRPANPGDPVDACSLHWVPLADALAPSSTLRADIFGASAPDHEFVTSLFRVEEGEVFAAGFYKVHGKPTECLVTLPPGFRPRHDLERHDRGTGRSRHANPDAAGRTSQRLEELELRVASDRRTRRSSSSPTCRSNGGSDYDFAAHFSLRQGFDQPSAVVPRPSYTDCEGGGPGGNPQCSPADNTWP